MANSSAPTALQKFTYSVCFALFSRAKHQTFSHLSSQLPHSQSSCFSMSVLLNGHMKPTTRPRKLPMGTEAKSVPKLAHLEFDGILEMRCSLNFLLESWSTPLSVMLAKITSLGFSDRKSSKALRTSPQKAFWNTWPWCTARASPLCRSRMSKQRMPALSCSSMVHVWHSAKSPPCLAPESCVPGRKRSVTSLLSGIPLIQAPMSPGPSLNQGSLLFVRCANPASTFFAQCSILFCWSSAAPFSSLICPPVTAFAPWQAPAATAWAPVCKAGATVLVTAPPTSTAALETALTASSQNGIAGSSLCSRRCLRPRPRPRP
mmetsp:Transcript_114127/g.333618  ORF Transcript_114127/g.333618 Transcript_114127/m.333618 type:complete len:318 (-) Transcript_114127:1-954(-)